MDTKILLLSPTVMKVCAFKIGDHLVAETLDSVWQSTFIAWPCVHQAPSSSFVHPDVFKALPVNCGGRIKVSLIQTHHLAKAVHLKATTPLPTVTTQLENALRFQYEGHPFTNGTHFILKDFGKTWVVCVDNVVNISEHSETSSPSEELESKMNLLTVDENSSAAPVYSIILPHTKIFFETSAVEPSKHSAENIDLSDFGGNQAIVKEVEKMCSSVYRQTSKLNRNAPKGILLYGPSGTGKSLLVKAVSNHFQVHLVTIQGPELYSKYYGETETRLRSKFDEAIKNDMSMIFIDEIDALCPKRDSGSSSHNDQERRVVATLISMMDSIPSDSRVIVIGVTNRPDSLDSALRRPGRLDRELEIRVPTVPERKEILDVLLRKIPNRLTETEISELAARTHGFVGADLSLLCKETSLAAGKRIISAAESSPEEEIIGSNVVILAEDAKQALQIVKPSAMREVLVEVPNVRWSDIGGQTELKLKLEQAVDWPLRHPEAFVSLGVEPPRGLLMFGPPGCSKTMIAKALATECGLNFIAVKGPELFSKWVGESERAVREVFRRARQVAPAIVFLDELDALGSARGGGSGSAGVGDRVLAQLLTEMDGIETLKNVTVVAATNRPDMIDKALLRPGRLDRIVYVPLPDEDTRREIFRLKFRKMSIDEQVSLDWLVAKTPGYSGAEVSAICNEAGLRAMEEDMQIKRICQRHFEVALSVMTRRISAEDVAFYENYIVESGMRAH